MHIYICVYKFETKALGITAMAVAGRIGLYTCTCLDIYKHISNAQTNIFIHLFMYYLPVCIYIYMCETVALVIAGCCQVIQVYV